MKIIEFEWLKQNADKLSEEDYTRIETMGIFRMIDTGEVNLSLTNFVNVMEELLDIVTPYIEKE